MEINHAIHFRKRWCNLKRWDQRYNVERRLCCKSRCSFIFLANKRANLVFLKVNYPTGDLPHLSWARTNAIVIFLVPERVIQVTVM